MNEPLKRHKKATETPLRKTSDCDYPTYPLQKGRAPRRPSSRVSLSNKESSPVPGGDISDLKVVGIYFGREETFCNTFPKSDNSEEEKDRKGNPSSKGSNPNSFPNPIRVSLKSKRNLLCRSADQSSRGKSSFPAKDSKDGRRIATPASEATRYIEDLLLGNSSLYQLTCKGKSLKKELKLELEEKEFEQNIQEPPEVSEASSTQSVISSTEEKDRKLAIRIEKDKKLSKKQRNKK